MSADRKCPNCENTWPDGYGPNCPRCGRSFAAPAGSAATWRVTADDDIEKEWDSDNGDNAFIDAEQAFDDGALKVTIQRIRPPNVPS